MQRTGQSKDTSDEKNSKNISDGCSNRPVFYKNLSDTKTSVRMIGPFENVCPFTLSQNILSARKKHLILGHLILRVKTSCDILSFIFIFLKTSCLNILSFRKHPVPISYPFENIRSENLILSKTSCPNILFFSKTSCSNILCFQKHPWANPKYTVKGCNYSKPEAITESLKWVETCLVVGLQGLRLLFCA